MTKKLTQAQNSLSRKAGSIGLTTVGLMVATQMAAAQDQDLALSSLDGVTAFEVHDDGSLKLILENGDTVIVDASDFSQVADQILLTPDAVAVIEAAFSNAIPAYLGAMGSVAVIGAAVGSGGGSGGAGAGADDDGDGSGDDDTVDPTVPVITSDSAASVAENTSTDTVVYTVTATDSANAALKELLDGDTSETGGGGGGSDPTGTDTTQIEFTYRIAGDDADLFSIDTETGEVKFLTSPDHETPGSAAGSNDYTITVIASNGTDEASQDVIITVTDIDEVAPEITSAETVSVAENVLADAVIYQATATDEDNVGTDVTFRLSGEDASLFQIDAVTGEVSFIASPDFETPASAAGTNVYALEIVASDGTNESVQVLSVTVTDVDETAAPVITSDSAVSIDENVSTDAVIYTVTATDTDSPGTDLTYSLSGADAASFEIDPVTGDVTFAASPDFETPGSAAGTNVYAITVSVSDGENQTDQAVTITVGNVDEISPVVTSPTSVAVQENVSTDTVIYTPEVRDDDNVGTRLSYAISGVDAEHFDIDPQTGEITFVTSPNFELPEGGANGDGNTYTITLEVLDGRNTTSEPLEITVENVSESGPVFTSTANVTAAEGSVDTGYTASATPETGNAPVTYSILGGVNADLFVITQDGVLSFKEAPDHEAPGGGAINDSNTYSLTIQATDGVNTSEQSVQVTVSDIADEDPLFTSANIGEADEGQTTTNYVASATPDIPGAAIEYSLLSGADSDLFEIDPTTGALSFLQAQDHEGGQTVFTVNVQAEEENGQTATQTVTIELQDVRDEDPVFVSNASVTMSEGQVATGYVPNATPDVDGDQLEYTIIGGVDAGLFEFNEAGELVFSNAPDHEAPLDAGNNNIYSVEVQASDGVNTSTQTVEITVQDRADNDPVFESTGLGEVDENRTVTTYTASATPDVDGASVTYSISGGADSGLFKINPITGELVFNQNPDHEAGQTTFEVIVRATETGGLTADQTVTVTVNDVSDSGPVFSSQTSFAINEGETATGYTPLATPDVDGTPVTYSILDEADGGLFTIDPQGQLSFRDAPDHEAPGGGPNMDLNTYTVVIVADDGTNTSQQTVTITVNDIADERPVFSSRGSGSAAEEQLSTTYKAVAIPDVDGAEITYSLVGGNDLASFLIDAESGVLSFSQPQDHDNGGQTLFRVRVRAEEESGRASTQDVQIFLTDTADEDPVFDQLVSPIQVLENLTNTGFSPSATRDFGNEPLTYTVTGGADAELFSIGGNGELVFLSAPDFETPLGGVNNNENTYEVEITASDGVNETAQVFQINVLDEDESADGIDVRSMTNNIGIEVQGGSNVQLVGSNISSVGDVNGDGVDDLLLSRLIDTFGTGVGEAFIIFGDSPLEDIELDNLLPGQGFRIEETPSQTPSVWSASSAGDVNGDGFDDFAISTTGDRAAYIVFGREDLDQSQSMNLTDLSADQARIITGDLNVSLINGIESIAISAIGDVDGDGYDDIIIGAPNDQSGGQNAGGAYVVFGGPESLVGSTIDLDAATSNQVEFIQGEDIQGTLGRTVSSAGDMNGDGYDDFLIQAPTVDIGPSNAGAVYIVLGAPERSSIDLAAVSSDRAIFIEGLQADARLGSDFASIGDVNGDGFDDIIVGAPGTDGNQGKAYVLYGGANLPQFDLSNLSIDQGFEIYQSGGAQNFVGSSVSSAGDVNGDGYDDFIVSAPGDTSNDTTSGAVFVIFGGQSLTSIDLASLERDQGFVIESNLFADQFGVEVSPAGDVNGDGFDDISVGAPGSINGSAYIIYGGNTGTEETDPSLQVGTSAEGEQFIGNAGSNSFSPISTLDVGRGGAGNDALSFSTFDFTEIDGGRGSDMLGLRNGGTYDFTDPTLPIESVETIAVTNPLTGPIDFIFDKLSVFRLSDDTLDGVTTLLVRGAFRDTLSFSDQGWVETGIEYRSGVAYTVWENGAARVLTNDVLTVSGDVTFANGRAPGLFPQDAVTVSESILDNTVIYTALGSDPDGDDSLLSYTLSGRDADLFSINDQTGEVTFNAPPDFEDPQDFGQDNVYDIRVTVTDESGLTATRSVTVTVQDAPDIIVLSSSSVLSSTREMFLPETIGFNTIKMTNEIIDILDEIPGETLATLPDQDTGPDPESVPMTLPTGPLIPIKEIFDVNDMDLALNTLNSGDLFDGL